jgi:hypothetical protein
MKQNNLEEVVGKFTTFIKPEHRYSSFDYCYNYFYTKNDLTKDMEKSCFELAFYLASWGMFRGSSFLLQKSSRCFVRTIEYINSLEKDLWKIDVNNYDDIIIDNLIEIYSKIKELIIEGGSNRSLTLVTKMMLGIFGFIPAYDEYFCQSFRKITKEKCCFRTFNKNSLKIIKKFYDCNKNSINKLSSKTHTYDFVTAKKTEIKYPKAKIIDMYGFTLSFNKESI